MVVLPQGLFASIVYFSGCVSTLSSHQSPHFLGVSVEFEQGGTASQPCGWLANPSQTTNPPLSPRSPDCAVNADEGLPQLAAIVRKGVQERSPDCSPADGPSVTSSEIARNISSSMTPGSSFRAIAMRRAAKSKESWPI